jgi:hypothetical protein
MCDHVDPELEHHWLMEAKVAQTGAVLFCPQDLQYN